MSSVSEIVQDSKLRSMSAAGGDTGDGMDDLLNWNNLTYKMPVTNSVVSARSVKQYPADRPSYEWNDGGSGTCGPIYFHLQAGEQYIDWGKSFIKLTLQHAPYSSATADLNFGIGSICNLIDTVIVTTRSGTEIHRLEQFGRWRCMQDRMHRTSAWFKNIGAMMGYTSDEDYNKLVLCGQTVTSAVADFCRAEVATAGEAAASSADATSQDKEFLIPISALGGPFATGQLSPAVLAGGLIIELRMTSSFTSCFSGHKFATDSTTQITAYADTADVVYNTVGAPKLKDIAIHLDTSLLNDAAMRALTQTAASEGLEIVYESCYHQQTPLQGTSVEVVCSKAVSRALRVYGAVFDAVSTDLSTDMNVPKFQLEDYYWRLGSIYFPNQKLSTSLTQYHNLLYMLEHVDDDRKHSVFNPVTFKEKLPYVAATFERSALLKYSGSAINNSRTLSFSGTTPTHVVEGGATTTVGYEPGDQLHFWLDHLTVAKTFLNNCIVSI